jgi:hypothetical protein
MIRTVWQRVTVGPFAPSEAAVGGSGFVAGALSGWIAGTTAGGRGLLLLAAGFAAGFAAVTVRDRTVRRNRRDGRRR